MVDVPGAVAASCGDRRSQSNLQGTAVQRGIDTSLLDGAGEIRNKGALDQFSPSVPVPFFRHSVICRSHVGSVRSSRSRSVARVWNT
jgi:hypothetical protein